MPSSATRAADCAAADDLAAAIERLCISTQPAAEQCAELEELQWTGERPAQLLSPKQKTWRASSGAAVLVGQAAVPRTVRTEAVTRSKVQSRLRSSAKTEPKAALHGR